MDSNNKITKSDILKLQEECLESIEKERLYKTRNDAKLRAVYTTQSYDEFKNIVDAAHITPLDKSDKMNPQTRSRLWNSIAK